jgi:Lhr-like helicase
MLVLGPTKELVEQLTKVAKSLSHTAKFSSAGLTSAGSKSDQKAALGAPLDVVFATPGRLLQHNEEGAVHLGDVQWVVVDEADTMILKVRRARLICRRDLQVHRPRPLGPVGLRRASDPPRLWPERVPRPLPPSLSGL